MLAFFDFQLTLDLNGMVQGLCKISEPKEGQSKSNYLSLFFIIDTPDDRGKEAKIDLLMKQLPWSDLKKGMPGIDMVVPMSRVSYGNNHYIKEVEIFLGQGQPVTRPFLVGALYPTVIKTLGGTGGDLVFWDKSPSEKKRLEADNLHQETGRSLIGQLIDYLKKIWAPECPGNMI